MTDIDELKPCPFCGLEPFRADGGTCFVGCSASSEECPVCPTVRTFGNADAVKFWNTRADDTLLTEVSNLRRLVEGLTEALKPFAAVADWYDESEPDTFEVWVDYPQGYDRSHWSQLKNFRRAASAIAEV